MALSGTIGDLEATIRAIGRGVVFYEAGAYAGSGNDVTLLHLGDTEGDITVEENPTFSELTTPELTGDIARVKYLEGIKPVITIPLLLADPLLSVVVNPTGVASGSQGGGYERHQAVTEYLLAIIPEDVFIENNAPAALGYTTAADWTVGGDVATATQLALLDKALWFWRGHFETPQKRFVHGDGGKLVTEAVFHAMHNNAMQQGHYVYTHGRPDQAATPIELSVT